MCFRNRVIANADYFVSKWAPVVLRFFQLFVGDPALAEALTTETFVEHIRNLGVTDDYETAVLLMRQALANGVSTVKPGAQSLDDRLVKALLALEPTQRAAIVLFRGLSLDLRTVAEITGIDSRHLRRVLVDALNELHRRLRAK